MKGIADIKSTIPHFQNPILSAADKYLHATSIRKKYARREIGQSEYFYRFRILHKYVRIRKLNRCNARPEQYECVHPPPGGGMRLFKGLSIVYPAVFSDKNKRAKFLKNCIKKLRFAEFFMLC